jgi:hypothetical protein
MPTREATRADSGLHACDLSRPQSALRSKTPPPTGGLYFYFGRAPVSLPPTLTREPTMQLLRILASSLLLASLALAQGGARPVHLAVVTMRDAATLDKLMALDLDLAGRNALELPVPRSRGDCRRRRAAAHDGSRSSLSRRSPRPREDHRRSPRALPDADVPDAVGRPGRDGRSLHTGADGGDPRRVRAQAPGDLHPKGQPWQVAREPRHLDDQDLR